MHNEVELLDGQTVDFGDVEPVEVEALESEVGDPRSLFWTVAELKAWKASIPAPAGPVPSQNTRGAAQVATEADTPWLNTRGAATYVQAPRATREPRDVARFRSCESRHRRSPRARSVRTRGSRRGSGLTASTRAGPSDSDPPLDDEPPGERRLLIGARR